MRPRLPPGRLDAAPIALLRPAVQLTRCACVLPSAEPGASAVALVAPSSSAESRSSPAAPSKTSYVSVPVRLPYHLLAPSWTSSTRLNLSSAGSSAGMSASSSSSIAVPWRDPARRRKGKTGIVTFWVLLLLPLLLLPAHVSREGIGIGVLVLWIAPCAVER